MTIELQLLVASVVLGVVHLIAVSHLISLQRGYRWTASSREEPVPPLRGLAHRVDQATTNFLESFPFFAAAVLAAHVTDRHSLATVCGAHLYFWGRLGYLLTAAAGYTLLRSVVFWNAAIIGILLFVVALLFSDAKTPNQATQLTASRGFTQPSMSSIRQSAATRAHARGSASLSR